MGDSNLHINVATRRYDKDVEKLLEPWVFEWVQKRNGSISAEHGLGLAKKEFIGYSRSDTMVKLMKDIKKLYDPVSISSSRTLQSAILLTVIAERYHESLQVHMKTSMQREANLIEYTRIPSYTSRCEQLLGRYSISTCLRAHLPCHHFIHLSSSKSSLL
jgi:phosphoenolpyruvate carboxylase